MGLSSLDYALVFVCDLVGLGLILLVFYLLGKRCSRKRRRKSKLAEPLLSVLSDSFSGAGDAATTDAIPKEVWSQDALSILPVPKETLAQLQIQGVVDDRGLLQGSVRLPALLAALAARAPQAAYFREQGVGWVAVPSQHRGELWTTLLGMYGPLVPTGSIGGTSTRASTRGSIDLTASIVSDDGTVSPTGRRRAYSGSDGKEHEDDVPIGLLGSPSGSASVYGVMVQRKDEHDLISLDAARCKFSKFRSEPHASRLEGLLRRWVRENPACQYYQVRMRPLQFKCSLFHVAFSRLWRWCALSRAAIGSCE